MFFHRKSQKSHELLSTLANFAKEARSISQIKELLKRLLRSLVEVAGAHGGSLWLLDDQGKFLHMRESLGGDPLILKFSAQDNLVHYLVQTERVLNKSELVQSAGLIDIKEAGLQFFTAANADIIFPLLAEKKFIGLLALGPQQNRNPYVGEHLAILEILANLGAVWVDNALLYDSLAKQNLKLSEIAKLKTQFVSTISHELSTPLNGILGLCQVLLDPETSGPLNDDQTRYLQMIQAAGNELNEIVQQILDLTRFQSQQGQIEVKKVDLNATIQGLEQEFMPLMQQKGISLELHLEPRVRVYGDAGQIRQVVQSILENALKFSPDNNSPKSISIQAARHGDMLKICVADQGIGITEADQEIIFEDFRQAQGSVDRSYGGTGLGLALAKKIVELHGGRIWVESKPGEGSQFFFTLPLKPALIQAKEINTNRH